MEHLGNETLGSGAKVAVGLGCILGMWKLKDLFKDAVGFCIGGYALHNNDYEMLYDMPVNPNTNVGMFVMDKYNGDPNEFLSEVLKRPHPTCRRFGSKVVKVFGNYYFKKMSKEEKADWLKNNTGVVYDVRSEEDALEFANMLK